MDFILWAARIPLLGLAACPPVPVANCMDYERAPAPLLPSPSPIRSMRTRSGRHWHRLSANLSLQMVNHTLAHRSMAGELVGAIATSRLARMNQSVPRVHLRRI